uniref:Histone-lysine N-methyltransferase SUVR5-like isoform X2 n=1 Tax=Rhizophora mucronata TaxID=61149 RepID=A0A2P2KG48_RHIMU
MNKNHYRIQARDLPPPYRMWERPPICNILLGFNTVGRDIWMLHNGKDVLLQETAHTDNYMSVLRQKLSAHHMAQNKQRKRGRAETDLFYN